MSSFSNRTSEVTAYEQSYVMPYGILALATTSTKFGVTAKDIIRGFLSRPIYHIFSNFILCNSCCEELEDTVSSEAIFGSTEAQSQINQRGRGGAADSIRACSAEPPTACLIPQL